MAFRPEKAENGLVGLNAMTHIRPGLVILDPDLPDVSGIGVLQTIRSWSNVPIIVLSIEAGEDHKVHLLQAALATTWSSHSALPNGAPFRQDISIVNGSVVSRADGAHDMIGRVDRDGNVRVSMYRAAEHAFGGGRLRSNFGSGVWKGLLSAHRCSGSWQAERH